MSDPQDKNKGQLEQATTAPADAVQADGDAEDTAASDVPEAPARPASKPKAVRRRSSALSWIALLLVLVVGAALGWAVWEQQRRDAGVAARIQAIEATVARPIPDVDALNARWQEQLQSAVAQIQADTAQLGSRTGQLAKNLDALRAQLAEERTELGGQIAELNRYNNNDPADWMLAEAQYLLRLGNQRLVMAGDVVATEALLTSADNILRGLNDMRLHDVRAAVATDLAALQALPKVDVEGVYLRLAALVEQADQLVIFRLPEKQVQPKQLPAEGWRGRLERGYETALAKLSDYIIIRRRDVPMQSLMDPQWEELVRQNLRMLLEQAQVALLSDNQVLYRASLERAQHWVEEFFSADQVTAPAMSREITRLMDTRVGIKLPDISTSVQVLDDFMQQRLQRGGAQ